MMTFQCELCHARNILGRDPSYQDPAHQGLLLAIRRANLDAFWSREPKTVRANLREAIRMETAAKGYGIACMTPPLGSFPLADSVGMKAALTVLARSLDPGRHEDFVQPNTYRKAQSVITNISRAGVGGLGEKVGAYSRHKVWISNSATHQNWFSNFMVGIKKRTGSIVKQDKPITIEILQAIESLLEGLWGSADSHPKRLKISRMGLWLIGGFCTALRGEEMLIVELAGFVNSLEHLQQGRHPIPYFYFTVSGRTKMNRDTGAKFKIPCAGRTSSGLQPGKWAVRYSAELRIEGRSTGYLFSTRHGTRSRLSDFEDDFYEVIESIQNQHPDLIEPDIEVREAFGIWRSTRRGVTGHAINRRVSTTLINLINRWRTEKDKQANSASMIDIYTELDDLIPTIIRYSHSL